MVPLIGRVDGPRATQLRNQLLNRVHTNRARAAVIDLIGVPKIESQAADDLIRTIEEGNFWEPKSSSPAFRPSSPTPLWASAPGSAGSRPPRSCKAPSKKPKTS